LACENGHLKVVSFLQQHGADLNIKDKYGWTPLHVACEKEHLEVVSFLLLHGADVNIKGNDGYLFTWPVSKDTSKWSPFFTSMVQI
jgi:ankyrin repeat protein